ncbi:MAG: large Ala/Glu-rich protein [Pseudobdellovibrio sp.]|nr:large Ala/Glu-rich protein [Pseudobdellovibrio sp.]
MANNRPKVFIQASSPKGVQTYEFHKSELIFGRSGKADLSVDEGGISREHLSIKIENNRIYIADLKSLNGAYVDGRKIEPHEFVAIEPNAQISFGKCPMTLKIYLPEGVAAAPAPSPAAYATPAVKVNEPSSDIDDLEFEIVDNSAVKKVTKPINAASDQNYEDGKNSSDEPIELQAHLPKVEEPEKTEIEPPKGLNEKKTPPPVVTERRSVPRPESKPAPLNMTKEREKAEARTSELMDAAAPRDKQEFEKLVDLSTFPKTEQDFRVSFKNVGLEVPKYKNPGEHAKEIIRDAEMQKQAILKSAEVFRSKTVNDTRIQAKKAAEEAHGEFKKLIDALLESTRMELKNLRTDTEILLDDKRIQANEEIQRLWTEFEEQTREEREKQREIFEKDNKIKLDLSIEKARSDMFAERHKIITDAENEVLQKKRTYQVEFENEKSEHLSKIKTYTEELNKIQSSIDENKKLLKEAKTQRDESELELSKTLSHLKAEKENLAIINNSFKETADSHKKIEAELANFNETKQKALDEIAKTEAELARLNASYANLSEKKTKIEEELERLNETVRDAKTKAKAEIEAEYTALRDTESRKFEDFKINELKELKKIRDQHSDSIKNFSVDLSQEIATKLELLASQSGYAKFNFEKHFELINSVIQVKASINTGSESKHAQQLEGWKARKRKENFSLMSRGFAAGIVVLLAINFAYKKLNVDPVQLELARIAAENKAKDNENRFIPAKTDKYFDNYVESTLYTERFSDTYLDRKNQQEWVNYATKYFLRQWKVEEEKVIQVISNSNALVQNVVTEIPNLKKSKLKADLAKLKELEEESIKSQAEILGSNVKYEAYKKLEREFFSSKLEGRAPASQ